MVGLIQVIVVEEVIAVVVMEVQEGIVEVVVMEVVVMGGHTVELQVEVQKLINQIIKGGDRQEITKPCQLVRVLMITMEVKLETITQHQKKLQRKTRSYLQVWIRTRRRIKSDQRKRTRRSHHHLRKRIQSQRNLILIQTQTNQRPRRGTIRNQPIKSL